MRDPRGNTARAPCWGGGPGPGGRSGTRRASAGIPLEVELEAGREAGDPAHVVRVVFLTPEFGEGPERAAPRLDEQAADEVETQVRPALEEEGRLFVLVVLQPESAAAELDRERQR